MKYLHWLNIVLMVLVSAAPLFGQESKSDRNWTAAQVRHAVGTATVQSDDPRPLWMALNAIEREYGWLVDYEDPIYEPATESVTHHNPQWESLHPGVPSRIPAGTSYTQTYPEDSQTPASVNQRQAILAKIVKDYNLSANPGRFELRSVAHGRANIVGYSRNPKGRQTSVLDTPIALSAGTTDSLNALQELAETLTRDGGVKVVLGALPLNLLARAQVNIKSGQVPARVTLTDIADSPSTRLMWDFLYDIDSRSYFLSLRPQSILVKDVNGRRILTPR